MYIQPNTTVILLTGVPLDESYDHTIKFTSAQAQQTYFMSKQLMRFDQHTYQRKERGTIRVNALADNLYHVNYLMFQNTAFGNKWFYAFVRSVNYINEQTTEIVYVIDTYQSWLFEMQVGECFVEREHIVNDVVGANLLDEGLQLGDHEITHRRTITGQGNSVGDNFYGFVVVTNPSPARQHLHAIWGEAQYNLMSMGCYFFYFDLINEDDNFQAFLSDLEQLPTGADQVITFTIIPKRVINNYNATDPHNPNDDFQYEERVAPNLPYTPKNKKLYQYPFCFIEASDNCGNSKIYKYEYFDKQAITPQGDPVFVGFNCGSTISPLPEMYLMPLYYNADTSEVPTKDSGLDAMLVSSVIPQLPYSTDSYKIWLAQNSTWVNGHRIEGSEIVSPQQIATGATQVLGASLAGAMAGATKGGAVGAELGLVGGATTAIVNNFNKVLSNVSEKEKAKLLPDKYNAGTGGINLQMNRVGFTLYCKSIRADMMRRIDSYFDMYGYKTNELKVPNMDSRPHWNFVKTGWANISGNIPADDIVKLKEIFNNGITFWKNPSEVGDYSLNNH